MSEIHKNVEKALTIYNCWWAYNAIQDNGHQHLTVNHFYNFVDPSTHAHTLNIERLMGSEKSRNIHYRSIARHHLKSYLV